MSEMFQCILVAADQYRGGTHTHRNAIALAKKLHASLRMIYMVDFEDLRVLAPGPPSGEMTRRLFRGTPREAQLTGEGRKELKEFATSCERASIEYSGEVLVGSSEILWAEEARSCDLAMILPAKEDFGRFHRWFGSMFWRIAARSGRPVLIFRPNKLPADSVVLFYSNLVESARALPWVTELCSDLGMSLTVFSGKGPSRDYARDQECQAFLNHHQISARFEDKTALEVLNGELNQPGSQLDSPSLLVFDGGFQRGLWFRRDRRLVEWLIRMSHQSILLCP